MNFQCYRYIVSVAEHKTIISASKELYVSPPAISKAIQKVEADIGVKLFNRDGNKLILTFAGDVFVKRAKNILNMQDMMTRELTNVKKLETGHLNIGVQMGIMSHVIYPIQEFHRLHPKVTLRIFESTHIELLEMLETNQVDVILSRVDVEEKSNCTKTLSTDLYILAVPLDHSLLNCTVDKSGHAFPWVDFSQCADEPFICALPEQNTHMLLEQICRQHQFIPRIEIEATSLKTCLSFVRGGHGIALSYLSNATIPYDNDELSILSFGQTPIVSYLIMSYNQNTYYMEIVETFSKVCSNYFKANPIVPKSNYTVNIDNK